MNKKYKYELAALFGKTAQNSNDVPLINWLLKDSSR